MTDENPGLFDMFPGPSSDEFIGCVLPGTTIKKTPDGMPAGGLVIPGFFTRGRQAWSGLADVRSL